MTELMSWWPLLVFAITSTAAGVASHATLKTKVDAQAELQTERYETLLRHLAGLDAKVEALTEHLLNGSRKD